MKIHERICNLKFQRLGKECSSGLNYVSVEFSQLFHYLGQLPITKKKVC